MDNAFFAKAKRVHSIVATLQPLAFNLLDIFSGRDISIERDDGDGFEKFVGSASRVGGLLQLVLCLPVLDESTTIPNLIAKLFNSAILPSVA